MSSEVADDELASQPTERPPEPEPEDLAGQATLLAQSGEMEAEVRAEADWRGRLVQGRYRVGDMLGEGGMGMVYVAEHVHLKKQVAFKVIRPSLAANPDLLARFTREALATGQLEHAHICAAIDFEQLEDGSAFLVMPFVRGHSLQEELDQRGSLPWREVCRLGAQIADALSAAHAVGIVHRDLKPDNVLVEELPDGSRAAKVLDFGVASLAGSAQSLTPGAEGKPLTQAGMILGTPGYMSTEQATAGEIDGRTDLYALGVVLWELRAGRRLFDGDDVTQIFAAQFAGAPDAVDVGALGPARELGELTMRLLAPDKESRPANAAEVRDTLRRLAEAPEPSALQVHGTRTLQQARSHAGELLRLGRERWAAAPPKMQRGALGAVAMVVVALGLTAIFGGDDPQAEATQGVGGAQERASDEASTKAAPKAEQPAKEGEEKAPPGQETAEAEGDGDSLIERVQGMLGTLPPELKEARETVFGDGPRRERMQAATVVKEYPEPDKVPEYLRLSAELELARGCRGKRDVLRQIAELGDSSALPLVERLDQTPQRGCGVFNIRDCLACMRRDIAEALEALN